MAENKGLLVPAAGALLTGYMIYRLRELAALGAAGWAFYYLSKD